MMKKTICIIISVVLTAQTSVAETNQIIPSASKTPSPAPSQQEYQYKNLKYLKWSLVEMFPPREIYEKITRIPVSKFNNLFPEPPSASRRPTAAPTRGNRVSTSKFLTTPEGSKGNSLHTKQSTDEGVSATSRKDKGSSRGIVTKVAIVGAGILMLSLARKKIMGVTRAAGGKIYSWFAPPSNKKNAEVRDKTPEDRPKDNTEDSPKDNTDTGTEGQVRNRLEILNRETGIQVGRLELATYTYEFHNGEGDEAGRGATLVPATDGITTRGAAEILRVDELMNRHFYEVYDLEDRTTRIYTIPGLFARDGLNYDITQNLQGNVIDNAVYIYRRYRFRDTQQPDTGVNMRTLFTHRPTNIRHTLGYWFRQEGINPLNDINYAIERVFAIEEILEEIYGRAIPIEDLAEGQRYVIFDLAEHRLIEMEIPEEGETARALIRGYWERFIEGGIPEEGETLDYLFLILNEILLAPGIYPYDTFPTHAEMIDILRQAEENDVIDLRFYAVNRIDGIAGGRYEADEIGEEGTEIPIVNLMPNRYYLVREIGGRRARVITINQLLGVEHGYGFNNGINYFRGIIGRNMWDLRRHRFYEIQQPRGMRLRNIVTGRTDVIERQELIVEGENPAAPAPALERPRIGLTINDLNGLLEVNHDNLTAERFYITHNRETGEIVIRQYYHEYRPIMNEVQFYDTEQPHEDEEINMYRTRFRYTPTGYTDTLNGWFTAGINPIGNNDFELGEVPIDDLEGGRFYLMENPITGRRVILNFRRYRLAGIYYGMRFYDTEQPFPLMDFGTLFRRTDGQLINGRHTAGLRDLFWEGINPIRNPEYEEADEYMEQADGQLVRPERIEVAMGDLTYGQYYIIIDFRGRRSIMTIRDLFRELHFAEGFDENEDVETNIRRIPFFERYQFYYTEQPPEEMCITMTRFIRGEEVKTVWDWFYWRGVNPLNHPNFKPFRD